MRFIVYCNSRILYMENSIALWALPSTFISNIYIMTWHFLAPSPIWAQIQIKLNKTALTFWEKIILSSINGALKNCEASFTCIFTLQL